jgi:ribonucleoside-diphosphate reductase beta chain
VNLVHHKKEKEIKMQNFKKKDLFNAQGDIDSSKRLLIGGNTTNLNDFNNLKYNWVKDWYRQAMNNFWIPEEINLTQDMKDYKLLSMEEKVAFDKILSFLIFLDSIQTANLPNIGAYITANEVNLCLTIHAFQEAVHSQSYGYMLDSICSPEERNMILYQWKDDPHLLERNQFIGDLYNEFQESPNELSLLKTMVANYILEGIYFYSGFMFFYNLGRNGKMPGSVQEIRYINRDENTHLWLFRSMIIELKKERPDLFTLENMTMFEEMIKTGVEQEIKWGQYVLGDRIVGLNQQMVEDYIKYLGNLRSKGLGLATLYEGYEEEPESMIWVREYSSANMIKTDFFEAKPSAYSKLGAIEDDL